MNPGALGCRSEMAMIQPLQATESDADPVRRSPVRDAFDCGFCCENPRDADDV
jgi:hypothetical protein